MKHLIQKGLLILCAIISTHGISNAQACTPDVYDTSQGGQAGEIDFTSGLSSSNMHFYKLGDGYYTWKKNPTYEYNDNPSGYESQLYFVDNKVPDPPELDCETTPGTSGGNALSAPLVMAPNIHPKLSWNLTNYADTYILLNFENEFLPNQASNGCVELHYNPSEVEIDVSEIEVPPGWATLSSATPGKIVWDYTNLGWLEQRVIYIPAVSTQAHGQSTRILGKIKDNCSGPGFTRGKLHTVSRWPHDPNKITVTNVPFLSYSEKLEEKYGHGDQNLVYEVQFHNDGEAPVEDVVVQIEFNGNFDTDNAELLDMTHSGDITGSGNGFLEITFDDIYLPGYGEDVPYEETVSIFSFEICLLDWIDKGDCRRAIAKIYFDNQPPVKAGCRKCPTGDPTQWGNPCETGGGGNGGGDEHIGDGSATPSIIDNSLTLSPNPANEDLRLDIKNDILRVVVYDLNGRKLIDQKGNHRILDVGMLSEGVYLLRVETPDQVISKKFMKR